MGIPRLTPPDEVAAAAAAAAVAAVEELDFGSGTSGSWPGVLGRFLVGLLGVVARGRPQTRFSRCEQKYRKKVKNLRRTLYPFFFTVTLSGHFYLIISNGIKKTCNGNFFRKSFIFFAKIFSLRKRTYNTFFRKKHRFFFVCTIV